MLLVDSDEDYDESKKRKTKLRECPLCCLRQPLSNFPRLLGCAHRSCRLCLMQVAPFPFPTHSGIFSTWRWRSWRTGWRCPAPSVQITCIRWTSSTYSLLRPVLENFRKLVGSRSQLIQKYEQFSIRRYLLTDTDARWCPAPDCGYAVIAASCAACPQLKCGRDTCGTLFCYHCKVTIPPLLLKLSILFRVSGMPIKPVMKPAELGASRPSPRVSPEELRMAPWTIPNSNVSIFPLFSLGPFPAGDIKACPRCHTYIVKMDDGSCNHMVCAMCSAEFCWLCLKEISDLHYLSPTGCTFWGKKPWTRKKKLLWQIGTLIGAPLGIALIAGLSIPGIIFGVPVFIGRKVHQRFISHTKLKRRAITAACVVGSLVVSPVLAVMAVGVGVPIMLAYVYGVVPLSLCRNGGCGLSDSSKPQDDDGIDDEEIWRDASGMERSQLLADSERQLDITSVAPTMSIQVLLLPLN